MSDNCGTNCNDNANSIKSLAMDSIRDLLSTKLNSLSNELHTAEKTGMDVCAAEVDDDKRLTQFKMAIYDARKKMGAYVLDQYKNARYLENATEEEKRTKNSFYVGGDYSRRYVEKECAPIRARIEKARLLSKALEINMLTHVGPSADYTKQISEILNL
jgi:hypothetical protein